MTTTLPPLKQKRNPPLICTQPAPSESGTRGPRSLAAYGVEASQGSSPITLEGGALLYSVRPSPSLTSPRALLRTVADDGLHPGEIERIRFVIRRWIENGAFVVFVTLGDAILDLSPREVRAIVRDFRNWISLVQKRAGVPQEAMVVFEVGKGRHGRAGLHAHVLLVGTRAMIG
jgi:hypothetical protein